MSNRQAHITKKMDIMTAEAKQKMAKKDKAGELLRSCGHGSFYVSNRALLLMCRCPIRPQKEKNV